MIHNPTVPGRARAQQWQIAPRVLRNEPFNSFIPAAVKNGLTILAISSQKMHNLNKIWMRNVHQNSAYNFH